MVRKYVTTIYAEDGNHTKKFIELQAAVDYVSKQVGRPIDINEVRRYLAEDKSFCVGDDWGRTIEVMPMEVGTCKVCKKKNVGLYKIVIDGEWQYSLPQDRKVRERQIVPVCVDCANDYECGGWWVEYEKGKHKIKKQTYDDIF